MGYSEFWEANCSSASQEIPCTSWDLKFITTLTTILHLSLAWATAIQFTPPSHISGGYVVILSSYLQLGLSSGLFPSSLCTETASEFLFCLIHATCLTNLIFLYLIAHIICYREYQWCSFSLCSLVQSPVISCLLDPYIFLSTLFLTALSLQSSLNVERLRLTPKCTNMQNYNSAHCNLYIFW